MTRSITSSPVLNRSSICPALVFTLLSSACIHSTGAGSRRVCRTTRSGHWIRGRRWVDRHVRAVVAALAAALARGPEWRRGRADRLAERLDKRLPVLLVREVHVQL